MQCPNCRQQIPDNALTCPKCRCVVTGASRSTPPRPASGDQRGLIEGSRRGAPVPRRGPSFDWKKLLISLGIALGTLALIFALSLLLPNCGSCLSCLPNSCSGCHLPSCNSCHLPSCNSCNLPSCNSCNSCNSCQKPELDLKDHDPNAYYRIFHDRTITEDPSVFYELTPIYLAKADSDGTVSKYAYGVNGLLIEEFVYSRYYPTYGYTADQVTQVEKDLLDQLSYLNDYDFIDVSITKLENYVMTAIHCADLENPANLASAHSLGLISTLTAVDTVLSHQANGYALW